MAESTASDEEKGEPVGPLTAWALYDCANGAFSVIISTFVFSTYFVQQVALNKTTGVIQWGAMLGTVGFLIAIGGPFLGAAVDRFGHRKKWIGLFAFTCIASTASLWFVKPSPHYIYLGLGLAALGTIGSEYSYIFYNAMLPELAPQKSIGRWSGWGWGLGYVGGVVSLTLCIFGFIDGGSPWIQLERSSAEDIRATFLLAASWFFIFSIPLFLFTPSVPGREKSFIKSFKEGVWQVFGMIKQARLFGPILLFLIARMFYTDGLLTLFSFGGVYAAAAFHLAEEEILYFGIALNICAGVGAAVFALVDDKIGSKAMILVSLAFLIVFSLLALAADTMEQFWVCGMILGVFVGPVQASSRSYLAKAAPKNLRNQMFGFYALTGRATAFMGPWLISWLTLVSGNLRTGMGTILLFFTLGGLLMLKVPSEAAIQASGSD